MRLHSTPLSFANLLAVVLLVQIGALCRHIQDGSLDFPRDLHTGGRKLTQVAGAVVGRYYCGTPAVPDPYAPTASWSPMTPTTLLSGVAGFVTPAPISFADSLQFVYQTSCVGPSVRVRVPVPAPGNYLVTMLLAEPFWTTPAKRVFDAAIEGVLLVDNIDVVEAVGAPFTAHNVSFVVETTDAFLTLIFSAVADQAMFSGLIIATTTATPPVSASTGTNLYCGTLNFTDVAGNKWSPVATSSYLSRPPGIGIAAQYGGVIAGVGSLARVYRTECFGSPSFTFNVPNNSWYAITFYFSENYWTLANRRKFSIVVEGTTLLQGYDIVADVGPKTAVNQTVYAYVSDGILIVNLVSIVDQACFAGISVKQYTPSGPEDPAYRSPVAASPRSPPPSPPPVSPKPSPPPRPAGIVFQMYCGSGTFFDEFGGIWADITAPELTSGAGVAATGTTIEGAPLELMRVYQSECFGGLLTIDVDVTPGSFYDVTILNQEAYWDAAGSRRFRVTAEGQVVVSSLDIWAVTGGKYKAWNTTFRVAVTDPVLNIRLSALADQARFSGIMVVQTSESAPLPSPPPPIPSPAPSPPIPDSPGIATWCGPTDYLDTVSGQFWQSRAFFRGAAFSPVFGGGIANASEALRPIYASECVSPDISAVIPVPAPGDYTITIMLAETWFTAAGLRKFSVTIQNVQVLPALDLYADYGPVAAANLTYVVPSVLANITVRFVASADQARVGGILLMPGITPGVPVITPAPNPAPVPGPPGTPPVNTPVIVPNDTSAPALSLNFNGPAFRDSNNNPWIPAEPYLSAVYGGGDTGADILGAPASLQGMLRSEVFGAYTVTIPVQVSGTYMIRFWNTEIFFEAPALRSFDIEVQGQRLVTDWDIFAESGGKYRAQYKEVSFPVTQANIVIRTIAKPGADFPTLKGLQLFFVSSSTFSVLPTPPAYSFQLVNPDDPQSNQKNFTLQALLSTTITGFRILQLQPDVYPDPPVFSFHIPTAGPQSVVDTASNPRISYDPPINFPRGSFLTILGEFTPRATSFYASRLEVLSGVTVIGAINIDGTGDLDANVPHVLHVVADGSRSLVDVDNSDAVPVRFDAISSHTHDPLHRIVGHLYTDVTGSGNTTVSTAVTASATLPRGSYQWNLTIFDDKTPPETKTETIRFTIYSPTSVPGTFAKFYSPASEDNVTQAVLPDAGVKPVAAARMPGFWLVAPLPARMNKRVAVVQMTGVRDFPTAAVLTLTAGLNGHAVPHQILVNGTAYTPEADVPAGPHAIEIRALINTTVDIPLTLKAGGVLLDLTTGVTYNEFVEGPVVNSITPTEGIVLGGTRITVSGFGWKMSDLEVTVGDLSVPTANLTFLNTNTFYFLAPAVGGPSTVQISVSSKGQTSNSLPYSYLAADQPVPDFRVTPFPYAGPGGFGGISVGQWCHGRYFVASVGGYLYEVTFSDDHTVMTDVKVYNGLATADIPGTGKLVLGLACNPYEPAEKFKIWLGHSDLFNPAQDPTNAEAFQGISQYSAAVGYFQYPEMNTYHIAIRNLPCATAFHSVASMAFSNTGLLYVGIGAQTNTGAPNPRFGDLPESSWSAGMMRADVMSPGFKGDILYEFRPAEVAERGGFFDKKNPNDQRWSAFTRTVANSTHGIDMFAYGLRNPLGITFHTNGNLYSVDNGPNADSGPAILSPFNYSIEYVGTLYDRIDLIEQFSYFGIGNENRALQGDTRQGTYIAREPTDKYYRPSFEETVDGVDVNYTQPIGLVLSSSNGMDEYRSYCFLGALRGQLIVSKLANFLYFVKLTPDGRVVADIKEDRELNLPRVPSLKAITGPGGVIIGIDNDGGFLRVLTPVDTAATLANLTYIYDVFPWRAPKNHAANATYPFVLSGANFNALGSGIRVFFGTMEATNATLTATGIIKGTIPEFPAAPDTMVPIEVRTAAGATYRLESAFKYLDDYQVQLDIPPAW